MRIIAQIGLLADAPSSSRGVLIGLLETQSSKQSSIECIKRRVCAINQRVCA
jgi:hypothetical protein